MSQPDLHFGAVFGLGLSETAVEARWLEELGYEYVSMGEHLMRGDPPGESSAALPVLAVAAGATSKIRLLSGVVLLPFYHPTLLAKLTSTLDIASGGRLTLGVGVGGEFPVEFQAAGIPFKQRGRRSDECLDALKRLWTEERVDVHGRHYAFQRVTMVPQTTQRPHPPIWVAGRQDVAMSRAVRFGDGWFPYFYSPKRYLDSVTKIKAMAGDQGRDLSGFTWANFQFISIYNSEEEAVRVAAGSIGGRYLHSGELTRVIRSYCVLGSVKDCIKRLEEYVEAGSTHFIFSWACPPEDRPRHMEVVAKEIIPYFRG